MSNVMNEEIVEVEEAGGEEGEELRNYCLECFGELEWVEVDEEVGELLSCRSCYNG